MESMRIKALLAMLLGYTALANIVMASPISWQQAQQNAQGFLLKRGKCLPTPSLRQVPMASAPACYIFNIGDNEGYIIASADDCLSSILGYSDSGSIDVNEIPDNLQWWLDEYDHLIQFMRSKGLSAPRTPGKSPAQPAISPLLTTRWNQTNPYNLACPLDVNGKRCVTGCVATAMAQVLYYHHARSVTQTTHEIPSYVTEDGLSVDAVPAGSFIDWDNMVDKYGINAVTTAEQDTAVANLMYYCGASVQMNYSSGSSGAMTSKVAPAMIAFFNYTSKTEAWDRNSCGLSDDEWENLIYHELCNSRPVLYSGVNKNQIGHAFVCDGYDGEGFFHFNWGWGSSGTYLLMTAIDSEETSLIQFSSAQEAIINAEPRTVMPLPEDGIQFADPVARALCLHVADADDDGAVTMEEAEAVTSMGPFTWMSLSSFDEFRYFTGVTTLNYRMFYGCRNLERILLHDNVTSIEDYAFNGCSSLKEISIPYKVNGVGSYAFGGCDSMKRMFWNAKNCLSSVGGIIPNSVEFLTIGDSVMVIPSSFAKNAKIKKLTIGKSVTKIASKAFINCTELKSLVIPDSVISLGSSAFAQNTGLEELTLGNSLDDIGDRAFEMCSSLQTVIIPNSVTRIGVYAFNKCTNLRSVVIGNSVANLSSNAFNGCDSLKTVTCLVPVPLNIKTNVFNNLYEQAILRVPASAVEAYQATAPWNQFSDIVAIDPSAGDVNLDGRTDIQDITILIDQMLKGNVTLFSDVNGDGTVSIDDVTTLIDKLLSTN